MCVYNTTDCMCGGEAVQQQQQQQQHLEAMSEGEWAMLPGAKVHGGGIRVQ